MIVTLCGSARFEKWFKIWNTALSLAGHSVFTLSAYPSDQGGKNWYTDLQKDTLDEVHKRKISVSQAVVVLNPFGYVGDSTISELKYANDNHIPIYALESWGIGHGICDMHNDIIQRAVKALVPEYKGSPIQTSRYKYVYDLLDDLSMGARHELVSWIGQQMKAEVDKWGAVPHAQSGVVISEDEALVMEAYDFGQFSHSSIVLGMAEKVRVALCNVIDKRYKELYSGVKGDEINYAVPPKKAILELPAGLDRKT